MHTSEVTLITTLHKFLLIAISLQANHATAIGLTVGAGVLVGLYIWDEYYSKKGPPGGGKPRRPDGPRAGAPSGSGRP